uniref:phenylalanine--tRNA ligase n=1 Tax=Dasyclonium flaccidum TaxID=2007274 RepID=A0A1Z1MKU5_9FLOR|nr:Phenylalanine-tRNA ligase beta subunit [Dasyclonium flaccidum]ARW66720.1 Phenylalanine-tRNA ligase beta subunit [Dasyclonium flaccidum]
MKFSWKLLNNIINLNNITVNKIIDRLIVSGIEVENIEYNKNLQDKFIDLSITSNRKEISSTIGLAREISTILNLSINNKPINLKEELYKKNSTNKLTDLSSNINYLRINIIHSIKKNTLPEWITNYLKICDIKYNNNRNNFIEQIQKYIKLKWGHTFTIINSINIQEELTRLNILTVNNNLVNILEKYKEDRYIIIAFIVYKNNKTIKDFNNLSYDNDTDYFTNAYYEAINLITTFTKCTISKSYIEYSKLNKNNNKIDIRKQKINQILGPIKSTRLKYISIKNTNKVLKELKFHPLYNKRKKIFTLSIPKYRLHDLQREIDIIEEIGRIYSFELFHDNLKKNNKKGKVSDITLYIKKIRLLLRKLGFSEVINSSLNNNKQKNHKIQIHNPITKEQNCLRNNLIEALIENYNNNTKHNKHRIEIFEISKIFEKSNLNRHNLEAKHLSCLMYNENFIRNTWSNKPEKMNWFHAKGIVETFLEQLNTSVIWKKIISNDTNQYTKNIEKFMDPLNRIGIYDRFNKNLIGILAELNNKYITNITKDKVYIFEIKIYELYKASINKEHLKYSFKKYSNYPKVTRDISIKIEKNKSIYDIKKIIFKTNKKLIKSIDIFNNYYNRNLNIRSIGLRITYRSNNRTLNNKDIYDIDLSIKNLLKELI